MRESERASERERDTVDGGDGNADDVVGAGEIDLLTTDGRFFTSMMPSPFISTAMQAGRERTIDWLPGSLAGSLKQQRGERGREQRSTSEKNHCPISIEHKAFEKKTMATSGLLSLPWVLEHLAQPDVETILDAGSAEVSNGVEEITTASKFFFSFSRSILLNLDLVFFPFSKSPKKTR